MSNELKKTLSPFQLWAIIVGMVISGMYFGWNNAMAFTSPVGFLIATVIVTIFYGTFMFSYAEMSTALPKADASGEFASRTMGRFVGFIAAYSCVLEFLFATPAIAISVGAYINFIFPSIPVTAAGLVVYALFVIINCFDVKTAAIIETVVTIVAILGLVIFVGSSAPHIQTVKLFGGDVFKGGFSGIFAAVPFAIWFYLGAEGGAMSAEECKNPKKDIPKSFIFAIGTLVVLAIVTFACTAGVLDVKALGTTNSPLPDTLAAIFGKDNMLSKFMSFIGLFGLIASLHGLMIGYSRQVFAMSRANFLPKFLSKVNSKGAPVPAIIIPSLVGMIFVLTNNTAIIIVISCFGAIVLHALSMIAFFLLRRNEPGLERPYKVSLVFPVIALILNVVFLITTIYSNVSTISWVLFSFVVAAMYYFVYTKISSKANKGAYESDIEEVI